MLLVFKKGTFPYTLILIQYVTPPKAHIRYTDLSTCYGFCCEL